MDRQIPEKKQGSTDIPDEVLARAFREGDSGAFYRLVDRYKDSLINFAYRYTGNRDDAEDIVQDTFVRVYHHIDQYKPVAKFSTWLYTITTNLARTHYRKRKQWGSFFFGGRDEERENEREPVDNSILPDQAADSALLHERIEQALQELPQALREIIILFEIEEKSYLEICEITGLNMGTVKSRLNRAKAKLQVLLRDVID